MELDVLRTQKLRLRIKTVRACLDSREVALANTSCELCDEFRELLITF